MKNFILSLFAVVFLVSCSSMFKTKSKTIQQMPIENTKWTLADNVNGKTPTLVIESIRVSGTAGCNNYFGDLFTDLTTGNFTVNNVGTTRMACADMNVEKNFLQMLEMANKYVVNGDVLELYKDNLLLLKFNKQ